MRAQTVKVRAAITLLHAQGLNQREIAERVNLTRPAVTYHARALGLAFPRGYHGQRRARDAAV